MGLEWVGNEASRGLKVNLGGGGGAGKRTLVRIEACKYDAKSGKTDAWENKGETKEETFIVKGTKVGLGVRIRTR